MVKIDTAKKEIAFSAKTDTADHYAFRYSHPGDSSLLLSGKWCDYTLEINLRQYNMNQFPLLKRKFRWIIDHNPNFRN
jgi:hypothetical protein